MGGCEEHPVCDLGGLCGESPETNAGENIDVVALPYLIGLPLIIHRREGTSSSDDRLSLRPLDGLFGGAFGLDGGVGEGEDDRPVGVAGHLFDDLLRKGAPLRADSNEDSRMGVGYDLLQQNMLPLQLPIPDRLLRVDIRALGLIDALAAEIEEPVDVDEVNALTGLLASEPFSDHGSDDRIGDTRASRPSTQDRDALLRDLLLDRQYSGKEGPHCDGCGPLDIVIEREDPVPVAVEEFARIFFPKIFPLEECFRIALRDGLHKSVDKIVIGSAGEASVVPTEIELIVQEFPIIGPHIEDDRQGLGRMDAAKECIERQLSDRDRHPPNPLVP